MNWGGMLMLEEVEVRDVARESYNSGIPLTGTGSLNRVFWMSKDVLSTSLTLIVSSISEMIPNPEGGEKNTVAVGESLSASRSVTVAERVAVLEEPEGVLVLLAQAPIDIFADTIPKSFNPVPGSSTEVSEQPETETSGCASGTPTAANSLSLLTAVVSLLPSLEKPNEERVELIKPVTLDRSGWERKT